MGYELRRMIRDGAPASWNSEMRLTAMEIADDARDPARNGDPRDGLPWSRVLISGREDEHGRWHDGLTERTGLSARAIGRALVMLGEAGYEMRVPVTMGKDGRVVYATKGHSMEFVVPPLPPRSRTQSPPQVEGFTEAPQQESPPQMAEKPPTDGRLRASKPPTDGTPYTSKRSPQFFPSPSKTSVVNGSEESSQPPAAKEPVFQSSFLVGMPGGDEPGPPGQTWARPSRWRDPQQAAQDQVAASRARRQQAGQSVAS